MSETKQIAEAPKGRSPKHIGELLDSEFMARLDALDVLSRKILQGKLQGERQSKRRGQGAEFSDHRPYAVGDDLRFVDWNIYSRLDQLFVKIFLEEQDLSVQVLVDASASMASGDPSKDLAAKRLAAALAYVGLVNNSRVTVSVFADGVTDQLSNVRGRGYLPRLADLLLAARPQGPSHFEKAARQIAAGRIGSGIMIVLSDFFLKEGFDDGLRRLISARYELYVIQMLSPQELSPELTGDLKLIDVEDGDEAEVTVSRTLIDYYKRNLSAYCNEIKDFCTGRGATYVLTNSGVPTQTLMLNYLRKRGLVG